MRWIAIACLLAACGKSAEDPGPSCAQVMDHILEVTKQELVGHGDELFGQRKAMIAQCEQRALSAAARKCLLAAKSIAEIGECRAGKPGSGAPLRKPPVPRAPGSGSSR